MKKQITLFFALMVATMLNANNITGVTLSFTINKNKNMKTRALQIFVLNTFVFLLSFGIPNHSFATGWQYRKSHTINSATGAGKDYQVMITIH